MLLTGMSIGCFFALGPVFASDFGLSTAQLGVFMAVATGAAMLAQWPLGRLSDRWSRRMLASILSGSAAVIVILFLLLPKGDYPLMLALAGLLGATLFPTQAIAAAQVNDRVDVRNMVAAAGTLVLVFALGAASGPVIGGLVMDLAGPSGFLLALLTFQLALFVLGAARLSIRPSEEGDTRSPIAPVIPQPVASQIMWEDEAQGDLFTEQPA
jgi:MFS family permease